MDWALNWTGNRSARGKNVLLYCFLRYVALTRTTRFSRDLTVVSLKSRSVNMLLQFTRIEVFHGIKIFTL